MRYDAASRFQYRSAANGREPTPESRPLHAALTIIGREQTAAQPRFNTRKRQRGRPTETPCRPASSSRRSAPRKGIGCFVCRPRLGGLIRANMLVTTTLLAVDDSLRVRRAGAERQDQSGRAGHVLGVRLRLFAPQVRRSVTPKAVPTRDVMRDHQQNKRRRAEFRRLGWRALVRERE